MPQVKDIDVENVMVLLALSVALIMAIWLRQDNLAMSIASGLLGYIGGTVAKTSGKGGNKDESVH